MEQPALRPLLSVPTSLKELVQITCLPNVLQVHHQPTATEELHLWKGSLEPFNWVKPCQPAALRCIPKHVGKVKKTLVGSCVSTSFFLGTTISSSQRGILKPGIPILIDFPWKQLNGGQDLYAFCSPLNAPEERLVRINAVFRKQDIQGRGIEEMPHEFAQTKQLHINKLETKDKMEFPDEKAVCILVNV